MNNDLKKILQKLEGKGNNGGINITFDEKGISSVRGNDGYTPVKGVDYFTEKEVRQIIDVVKEMATPVKGKDYFTALEVAQMIRSIESKVKHGIDGKDGRDGKDGKDAEEVDTRKVAIDAINFLESFEGDARLSAKALKDLDEAVTDILKNGKEFAFTEGQIKTIKDLLPQYPPINAGGSGATFLKSLRDVDLSGLTKNADGKYVLGGGSGASTFTALTDTPASYTGQAGKFPKVNATEDGLVFETILGGGDLLATNNLSDVSNVATARTNLGLGTAAQSDTTDFAPALGADDNYVTDAEKTKLSNLSGTNTGDQDLSGYLTTATAASTYEPIKGVDDNYVTDAEKTKLGHISVTQAVDLDAIETRVNQLDAAVVLKGSWNASAGTFPGSGTAQAGDSYIVSVGGTVDSVVFNVGDRIVAILDNASTSTYASNWLKLDYTDQVSSVAGKTGAVTLVTADITDITASAAELNILDGATVTTAELNILDGVTATASELNVLDGITATVTELNYTDGVTSNIQTQLNAKAPTASPTLTGTTTVDRLDYDRAVGGVSAIGNLGATETIDWSTHTHYTGTLNSNITFTYSNQVSGESKTLYLSYDGTAQRTITWPTTTWLDNATGAAPTAPAASGNVLVVTLVYIGTTVYGSATGNYAVYS